MKKELTRLFYQLFRSKTPLEICGIRKIFWSAEPRMHQRIVWAGGEREQLEYFIKQIRDADVVWDVGAFIGMFSMFASQAVGANGQVFTFEPEASTAELVKKNCAYNNISNITLIEAALGEEDGEAMIYSSEEDQNAISSLKPGENLKKQGIPIQIRTGESLVRQHEAEPPTVVKMDVEGAEYQALKGMREVLERPECRFLFLELHPQDLPRFGASEGEVRDLLGQVGFNIDRETQRGTEMHLFCSK